MPVEAAAARSDTVVDAILATGQIEAMQSIELRPEVEGRMVQILVREGALVARGTPLFKIDDAELKAQVAEVEAERDLARQSLTRTRDLLSQKASSQAELERAEATMRSNEAQLERLKVRLERTLVRAPFCRRRWPAVREPGRLRDQRLPGWFPCRLFLLSGPPFRCPSATPIS